MNRVILLSQSKNNQPGTLSREGDIINKVNVEASWTPVKHIYKLSATHELIYKPLLRGRG